MKANIFKIGLAVIAIAFVFSSCIKSVDPPPPTPPQTYVSVMYLAPTGPSLDVFFNNAKVSTAAFGPGTVTPAFSPVDKGSIAVKFKKAGADSLVTELPAAQYDSLNYYTLFLYNQDSAGAVNVLRVKEDFSGVIGNTTNAFYRFYHTVPNLGAVDLYLGNVKAASNRTNADNVVNDIFNKFTMANPDFYMAEARLAGTGTVLAFLPNVDLRPGNAYTFYLKGLKGGTGSSQLTLQVLRAQ